MPALTRRSGVTPCGHFHFDALRPDAVSDVPAGAGAGCRGARVEVARGRELGLVLVRNAEVLFAPVDVLDDEDRSVERVQLEVFELLAEQSEVEEDAAGRILAAELPGIDDFRIELQPADQRLRAALRSEREDRDFQRRTVEVEAARLIAAREAAVEQQVVVRLVGKDARAGELVLLALVADRNAVELRRAVALAAQAEDGLHRGRESRIGE